MSEVVITTPRLILRPFTQHDAVDYHRNTMADADVMRFLLGVKPIKETKLLVKNRFRKPEKGKPGVWSVAFMEDPNNEVVGHVGYLTQELDGEPVEEMSYRLARRHWGKGLATEAAIAARDWFFEHTDLEFFVGFILPENASSTATAERIGMRYWKDAVVKGFDVRAYRMYRNL